MKCGAAFTLTVLLCIFSSTLARRAPRQYAVRFRDPEEDERRFHDREVYDDRYPEDRIHDGRFNDIKEIRFSDRPIEPEIIPVEPRNERGYHGPATNRYSPRYRHERVYAAREDEPHRDDEPYREIEDVRFSDEDRYSSERRRERDRLEKELEEERRRMQLERDVEECEIDMARCKFTADELVDKILQITDGWEDSPDTDSRSNGAGVLTTTSSTFSTRPITMPPPRRGPPGPESRPPPPPETDSIIPRGPSGPRYHNRGGVCRSSTYCAKNRRTNSYLKSCRSYLYDRRTSFYQRKLKMISCYRCRSKCSSVHYI